MSSEEADEQKGERIYNGASLNAPAHWEHKQHRLTMTMVDTFDYEEDPPRGDRPAEGYARRNPRGGHMKVLATTMYRRMRSGNYTPDDIIYGTVHIGNEHANKVIDFTKEDLTYICKQVLKPRIPK